MWDLRVTLLDEGAVDGGRVGEGRGRHCHRSHGQEDGVERRPRPDPLATDGARRRGVDDRRGTRAETATSGACAVNPSDGRKGRK